MFEEIIEAIKRSIGNQAILQDLRISQGNVLKEEHFMNRFMLNETSYHDIVRRGLSILATSS